MAPPLPSVSQCSGAALHRIVSWSQSSFVRCLSLRPLQNRSCFILDPIYRFLRWCGISCCHSPIHSVINTKCSLVSQLPIKILLFVRILVTRQSPKSKNKKCFCSFQCELLWTLSIIWFLNICMIDHYYLTICSDILIIHNYNYTLWRTEVSLPWPPSTVVTNSQFVLRT